MREKQASGKAHDILFGTCYLGIPENVNLVFRGDVGQEKSVHHEHMVFRAMGGVFLQGESEHR